MHRFCATCAAGGEVWVPRKVFYDFGLAKVVQDRFFTNPEWCALRGTDRSTPGDYYTSPKAQRLHDEAGADIADRNTSVWALGLDFCQWWKSKGHSTGFLTLRCEDMPHSHRSKLAFTHIIVIIPGPSEPACMDGYLENVIEAFKQFAPGQGGLDVTEHARVGNSIEQRRCTHKMLLGAVYGDSPGIKKLAKWLSHSAYLGCGYCLLRGTYAEGAVRFLGYLTPTNTSIDGCFAMCGDPAIRIDHAWQSSRADAVADDGVDGVTVGCNGRSTLIKELPYLDYQNTFVVPVPHAALLGVVKDFWSFLLRPMSGALSHTFVISSAARAVIKERARHIVQTCDFQRAYSDIVDKRGYWVMEDWLHWTETWSVYVLMPHNGTPVLPEPAMSMWKHLRAGLLYFCRVHPLPDVAQSAEDACAELLEYAKLVEQHFGPKMCKFNLHVIICRLLPQELARGKAAFGNEYWIENLIQWAKSIVRGRTSKYPELVLVHDMLVDAALACMRRERPNEMMTAPEWLEFLDRQEAAQGADASASPSLDVPDADGSQLMGVGSKVSSSAVVQVVTQAWQARMEHGMDVAGWQPGDFENASMLAYKHALVQGSKKLHSVEYHKARTSESFYTLVTVKQNGTAVQMMAKVLFFVKLASASRPDARLAVCELYAIEKQEGAAGTLWHTKVFDRPTVPSFAVTLAADELGEKHVAAYATAGSKHAWFVPYRNMSGQ